METKWNTLELYDFFSQFSPRRARLFPCPFYAKGTYSVDGGEDVAYRTRASSVWTRTNVGWKIVHGNWHRKRAWYTCN